MSVVVNGTIDVLSKALQKFAGEDKAKPVRPSDVILIIALSDITVEEPTVENPIKRVIGEPFYRVIKGGEPYMRTRKIKVDGEKIEVPTDEVSFLQVLDALVDFFQTEASAKPFLIDAFRRFTDELNSELRNNAGFIAYIDEQVGQQSEGKAPEEIEAIKAQLINDNEYDATDLEIWVVTPKETDRPGVALKDQDQPVRPIPILYAANEQKRTLTWGEDVFQLED